MKSSSFDELKTQVIDKNLCTGCGACVAVCPNNCLKMEENHPVLVGKFWSDFIDSATESEFSAAQYDLFKDLCFECDICTFICPRTKKMENVVEEARGRDILGKYSDIYAVQAVDQVIGNVCQDGGAVSALLAYAIQNGIIDGAVVSQMMAPWERVPTIVKTDEELLASAGTLYSLIPTFQALSPYESVVNKMQSPEGQIRLAFVGMPCQILAFRKMQSLLGSNYLGPSRLVSFTIGLFCMENFDADCLKKKICDQFKIRSDQVKKLNIKGKKILIHLEKGEELQLPIKEVESCKLQGCRDCTDFTSEFADISVGGVGSPDKWSTVIVRTPIGNKIFDGAYSNGFLSLKTIDTGSIELISKVAKKKRTRGLQRA